MAKVWWKFEQNWAVGTKVTEQNHTKMISEWRNDGITDRLKTVYPPKTTFCGGYNDPKFSDR